MQVVWFKRDLRVSDHRPLYEASLRGPVLPLFVIEEEMLGAPDASALHWNFQRAALHDLGDRLALLGSPLVVRHGEAVAVLEEIRRAHGISHLWAHEETGNAISYARDRRVRRWAKENGVPFVEYPRNGVVRRLTSRDGWAKRWEARMAEPIAPAPERLIASGLECGGFESSPALYADRRTAEATLDSFLSWRGERYTKENV